MDRGAWWATVHGKVSDMTERLHFHFQTMVEVMKIMVTSFRRSHACTATLTASNPAAGHHQTTPPLDTPGHSHSSLGQSFVGSLLLSPGSWYTQGSVCALPESVSPVLCKFWPLYDGVKDDLLQESLCHIQVCCTQSPALWESTADPYLHRRCSNTVLCQSLCGLWVLVCTRFV